MLKPHYRLQIAELGYVLAYQRVGVFSAEPRQVISDYDACCVFPRSLSCLPVMRRWPPRGDAQLHKIKFDGWRIQLHKTGASRST